MFLDMTFKDWCDGMISNNLSKDLNEIKGRFIQRDMGGVLQFNNDIIQGEEDAFEYMYNLDLEKTQEIRKK